MRPWSAAVLGVLLPPIRAILRRLLETASYPSPSTTKDQVRTVVSNKSGHANFSTQRELLRPYL